MIYLDLFLGFLKVGCFAFGGAYGAIPLIRDVVMSYGQLRDEMLTYMIAVSESTPRSHHGQPCHLVSSSNQAGIPLVQWSQTAGGCSAFVFDYFVGNSVIENCIEEQICSSCVVWAETLRNRHYVGLRPFTWF